MRAPNKVFRVGGLALAAVLLMSVSATKTYSQEFPTFKRLYIVYNSGTKVQRTRVTVQFRGDVLLVLANSNGGDVKRFNKADIVSVEHSQGELPRFTDKGREPFTLSRRPLFLRGTNRHWLVIQSRTDICALQLSEANIDVLLDSMRRFYGKPVVDM